MASVANHTSGCLVRQPFTTSASTTVTTTATTTTPTTALIVQANPSNGRILNTILCHPSENCSYPLNSDIVYKEIPLQKTLKGGEKFHCQQHCCEQQQSSTEKSSNKTGPESWQRRRLVTGLCSTSGLLAMVTGYAIMGALVFPLLETPATDLNRSLALIARSREECLRELWIITEKLNVLYERNWTVLVHEQLKRFEGTIMAATSHLPKPSKGYSLINKARGDSIGSPNSLGSRESMANQLASTARTKKEESWSVGQMNPTEITIQGFPERSFGQWTFSKALLYSITILTTIGHGGFVPRTSAGKIVTILYALIGVPLMLLCLSSVGGMLAEMLLSSRERFCGESWSRNSGQNCLTTAQQISTTTEEHAKHDQPSINHGKPKTLKEKPLSASVSETDSPASALASAAASIQGQNKNSCKYGKAMKANECRKYLSPPEVQENRQQIKDYKQVNVCKYLPTEMIKNSTNVQIPNTVQVLPQPSVTENGQKLKHINDQNCSKYFHTNFISNNSTQQCSAPSSATATATATATTASYLKVVHGNVCNSGQDKSFLSSTTLPSGQLTAFYFPASFLATASGNAADALMLPQGCCSKLGPWSMDRDAVDLKEQQRLHLAPISDQEALTNQFAIKYQMIPMPGATSTKTTIARENKEKPLRNENNEYDTLSLPPPPLAYQTPAPSAGRARPTHSDVVLCGSYLTHQTSFPVAVEYAGASRQTVYQSSSPEKSVLLQDFPPEELNYYYNSSVHHEQVDGNNDEKNVDDRSTWQQIHVLRGNHVSTANGCVTASSTNRTTNAKRMTIDKEYSCKNINGYSSTTIATNHSTLTSSRITTATTTASILTGSRMASRPDAINQEATLSSIKGNLTTCSKLSCGIDKIETFNANQQTDTETITGSCHLVTNAVSTNAQLFITSDQMHNYSNNGKDSEKVFDHLPTQQSFNSKKLTLDQDCSVSCPRKTLIKPFHSSGFAAELQAKYEYCEENNGYYSDYRQTGLGSKEHQAEPTEIETLQSFGKSYHQFAYENDEMSLEQLDNDVMEVDQNSAKQRVNTELLLQVENAWRKNEILLAIFILVMYILLGALVLHYWLHLSLIDGIYFCFVSLTTIGYTDLVSMTSTHSVRTTILANSMEIEIIAYCSYLMMGLALVSMSFNLLETHCRKRTEQSNWTKERQIS